jgi:hypothetical protein
VFSDAGPAFTEHESRNRAKLATRDSDSVKVIGEHTALDELKTRTTK